MLCAWRHSIQFVPMKTCTELWLGTTTSRKYHPHIGIRRTVPSTMRQALFPSLAASIMSLMSVGCCCGLFDDEAPSAGDAAAPAPSVAATSINSVSSVASIATTGPATTKPKPSVNTNTGNRKDGEACSTAGDCKSGLECCLTVLGRVCKSQCGVFSGRVCSRDADCSGGQKCELTATGPTGNIKTCTTPPAPTPNIPGLWKTCTTNADCPLYQGERLPCQIAETGPGGKVVKKCFPP